MSAWINTHNDSFAKGFAPGRNLIALGAAAMAVVLGTVAGVVLFTQTGASVEAGVLGGFGVALGATAAALTRKAGHAEARETAATATEVPTTGIVLTGSVASDVVLDYDKGTAAKVYRPTLPVKLLYAVSFQSKFPYTTNQAAFVAAEERRAIAGLLSEYWFGENYVSPVLSVEKGEDGRYVFTTELVRGTEPKDTVRARAFLNELQGHFEESGLPPWQVASYNPRAIGNIIERTDGVYRIIDLESNLVSPFLRPRVLWRAIRNGQYPTFDDIDVKRLENYLSANAAAIEASLGSEKAIALRISATNYGVAQGAWHASERRWAPKLLRAAAIVIDVPGWLRGIRRLASGGDRLANDVATSGINAWVDEGLMTRHEAEGARAELAAPEMTAATANLGAHLAMSVPLRFPLGSIARSGWTISARLKGEWQGLRNAETRRAARNVHSLPVAALGAVPGFGAFAYLAAKPFRRQRVLRAVVFDQSLRHLPFKLHSRLHLSALSRWMALPAAASRRAGSWSEGVARAWPAALAAVAAIGGLVALDAAGATENSTEAIAYGVVALAAVPAVAAFRGFWKTGSEASSADQAGSFLWGIAGVGALVVGLDLAFGLHEAAAGAFESLNVPMVPGSEEAHVLMMGAYALSALATGLAFRHEVFSGRGSGIALAAAGVTLSGAMLTEAAGLSGSTALAFIGAPMLLAAGLTRWGEVTGTSERIETRAVEGWLASERFAHRVATMPMLTVRLVALCVAVGAVALAGSAVVDPGSLEPAFYRDFGPVTFFSSGLMLLAGVMGISAWRRDRSRTGRDVTSDLWAVWGIGFIVLAFDATPNLHGHLGGFVESLTGVEHPFGFHRTSDAMVAVYALTGLAITGVLGRQVFQHPTAILRFSGAIPFGIATIALDGYVDRGWAACVLEEGAELMALCFFISGFAQRYRESGEPVAEVVELPARGERMLAA